MPRFLAHLFSTFGHPMLVPTYALLLLLFANPYSFGVHSPGDKKALLLLLYVFTTTALIPGIGIAVMKPLGFVRSLESPDRQERIGPYIVTGVFYLWLYQNLKSGGQAPPLYQACVLGATIALFAAFFINIFTKVSAHATGMGGLVGMLLLLTIEWPGSTLGVPVPGGLLEISLPAALAAGVIVAGCVGTARLVLKAHVLRDLWQGYLVGFGAACLAWWVH
ncbi:MAG: hypothetical protein JNJ90_14615 [Saprospiraceae bacterium]|jgi:hypothetical protein|nr:hypothetical protein [Saprospiraceae bacterium]